LIFLLAAALVALVVARDAVLLAGSIFYLIYTLGWQVWKNKFHHFKYQPENTMFPLFLLKKNSGSFTNINLSILRTQPKYGSNLSIQSGVNV
jgi:hypothetical protein